MARSTRRVLHAAILAVVVTLFSITVQQARAITSAQREATLTFLQSFPVAIPSLASSWTGTDYCSWDGITCDTDGYVSINLSGRKYAGTTPAAPASITAGLVSVVSIDLSNNPSITGTFPNSWAMFTLLKNLDLSSTGLYGALPDAWNGMISLQTVKISNTNACKGLPNWVIATLKNVDLSNNKLTGALANSWGGMLGLKSVDLTGNSFCGCVPITWRTPVLKNAAKAASSALVAPDCSITNICTDANYVCGTQTTTTATPTSTPAPTAAPTTTAPTTAAPTTAAPSTAAPTTAAPTTAAPTTAAPSTAAPTTAAPTTATPTTAAPTTAAPTTAAPTTEAPAVCYVAHCSTCYPHYPNMCYQCDVGYNVKNDGSCMVTGYCEVAHCAQCLSTDYTFCSSCNKGYRTTTKGTCTRARNAAASPASMLVALAALAAATLTAVY
jgi:hypothetical protein